MSIRTLLKRNAIASSGWRLWRRLSLVAGLVATLAACSALPPLEISNGTAEDVVLVGCAQEPHMDRVIPRNGTFTFSDNLGERTLSDDPGFACLLRTSDGDLMCLRLPTDQTAKTVFAVEDALPTYSFSTCVAQSDPHI
jgi:hypothetical protein